MDSAAKLDEHDGIVTSRDIYPRTVGTTTFFNQSSLLSIILSRLVRSNDDIENVVFNADEMLIVNSEDDIISSTLDRLQFAHLHMLIRYLTLL